ncbi:MAG TPA: flagellar basal-body rod protein FlgF [Alphaproteobacteria bacterium]
MENAGYIGLSYQLALQRKMDMVSNNIANMDTTGFKSQHMRFKEHVSARDAAQPISMVSDMGAYKNFNGGTIISTENPLDIALLGNGFLQVRSPDGGDMVTRNGRMLINSNNQLATADGSLVLGRGGQPITLPDGETSIRITPDGMISGKQGQIGELGIVSFQDPQSLQPVGDNMFTGGGGPLPDTTTRIQQGALEGSNVNPILEMTDMMTVQRNYQSVARMLQTDHDRQRDAIRKLATTN